MDEHEREEIESASEETIKQMDKQSDDDETISNVEPEVRGDERERRDAGREAVGKVRVEVSHSGKVRENRITIDDFPSLMRTTGNC